ncbi:MAG: cytochrome d ubiquinol oxidase subunit II [Ponticaulis sp.]|nr:cytochrome d ubiquinol oxidase subunit II [Ponticaulis sp.]|tara:strand:+ start:181218 stop:182255 length:1038 start_codon:yes stop_codon:yes gene_type:complete
MDLPLIWALLIATAVMLYVILDGSDLGIGILTAFAKSDHERNLMTATIEPVWDGNETWLILGGGGLFAAFPLAYAILMPAFYIPVLIMLAALIFRGVAFEFRHKAVRKPTRIFWNGAFSYGSLTAALAQGFILGGFIQGVEVEGRAFAGGSFDWLTPFSVLVAISVAGGYVLLGSCWLVLKTEGDTQKGARKWARRATIFVLVAMAAVSLATLSIDARVTERWGLNMQALEFGKFLTLAPIPFISVILAFFLWRDIWIRIENAPDWRPMVFTIGLFLTGYLGLAFSLFPNLVPFDLDIWQTAARDNALMLMLVGAVIMLPVILGYTIYVYSLFWGKVDPEESYHD